MVQPINLIGFSRLLRATQKNIRILGYFGLGGLWRTHGRYKWREFNRRRVTERMAMASMHISLPNLTPPNLRRVNWYCLQAQKRSSVIAMASSYKEIATSGVKVTDGEGNLPKVVLTGSNGSEADVYLFGGCITSWKVPNGKDLLFVRPDAVFNGQKPISGGVPHCFPQFGPGPMQQHGFARNLDWSIVDSENVQGDPVLTLELKDGPYSRAMWDFSFQALYKITLQTKSLSTELVIKNTDSKPFSFSTALHTYFSASVQAASVKGLKGRKTLNKDPDPKNPLEARKKGMLSHFLDLWIVYTWTLLESCILLMD
ncbi:hypothetical protein ACLB2K_005785 [Fragaria x ananassa]